MVDMNAPQTTPREAAVGDAFRLLEILASRPHGAEPSALAEEAGLSARTLADLGGQLTGLGMVEGHAGRWHIGSAIVRLGKAAGPEPRLRAVAQPFLELLSAATGWPSGVFVVAGDVVTTVAVADWLGPESRPPFPVMRPGLDFPLSTAAGKALLASTGADRPSDWSPSDWEQLRTQLERTGVVVESEEVARDLGCIAAPVAGEGGRVAAAVCVLTLRNAATPKSVRAVRHAAAQIGGALRSAG